jgi:hypothetical protein
MRRRVSRAADYNRPRAARLLTRVVATGLYSNDVLARHLVIPTAMLEAYLLGHAPIPLDRQLVLAALVIERVPSLARRGRHLRAQIGATLAYTSHATTTHDWMCERR